MKCAASQSTQRQRCPHGTQGGGASNTTIRNTSSTAESCGRERAYLRLAEWSVASPRTLGGKNACCLRNRDGVRTLSARISLGKGCFTHSLTPASVPSFRSCSCVDAMPHACAPQSALRTLVQSFTDGHHPLVAFIADGFTHHNLHRRWPSPLVAFITGGLHLSRRLSPKAGFLLWHMEPRGAGMLTHSCMKNSSGGPLF